MQLLLPVDVVVADKFDANANTQIVDVNAIPDGWMGLDIGPKSIKLFQVRGRSGRIREGGGRAVWGVWGGACVLCLFLWGREVGTDV